MICPACTAPNPEGARFCNSCGARLAEPAAPRETRRTVTILFVDVAGSTAIGERLDPEALRVVIGRYFDLARDVVERHGGTVEKFIGDAVMAVFGIPTLHEDDALRAVRAAAELVARLAESPDRIDVRIGVNTGPVVAGDAAEGQRLVTGDAVNVAARLEQAASPGEILLGAETHRLVRDAVVAEEVAPIVAKGKSEPLRAFRLGLVSPAAGATVRHLDAPLVGRDRELGRLLRSFEDVVAERRCGLFTLLGPAGVGKSRLVHELVARVRDRATILRGRCLPYGEGITYWPIAEMVRFAAGIDDADDREAAIAKLRALVDSEADADEIVARVGAAVGLLEGEGDREDVFRAVRRVLETLAANAPVVAILDDLQWAEPTLLDLVEHIVDWSRGSPILVVALARPDLLDLRPGWGGGKLDAQTVLLEGLGAAETRALAGELLGGDVDPRLLDRIDEVAEGNPLFVEQLVAMLVEDGHLVRDGDAWRPVGDLREIDVPPTISALLAARLDRLPSDERLLAERASVVGRVFESGAVAQLSPEAERGEVSGHLRSLVRRELIRPDPSSPAPQETFRFRHILIRDAAYDALPKRDRAELHARFADWLEMTTAGRLAEYEEIVGYHFDQAARYREELGLGGEETAVLRRRAAERLARAGERAFDRGDLPGSIRLLGRVIELAPPDGEVESALTLGTAYLDMGLLEDAQRTFEDAERRAVAAGDEAAAHRTRVMAVLTRAQSDPAISGDELDAVVDEAMPVLERAGYDRGLVDAWLTRAIALLTRSQWAPTLEAFERAALHAERAGAGGALDFSRLMIANALAWGPTPASVGVRRCRELLPGVTSRRAAGAIEESMTQMLAYLGRADEARDIGARVWRELEEIGVAEQAMGSRLTPAEVEIAAGDLERAVELLSAGRDSLAGRGETGVRSTVEGELSVCLAWLGRDHEAIEASLSSERLASHDDMASQSSWRSGRALAFAHLGRLEEAVALADAAVELMERLDQLNFTAECLRARAEVRRLAGSLDEAAADLDRAIELFERKENVLGAERARRERAALDG